MFKHEEVSIMRGEFWTTFGQYMSPVPSSDGSKRNWINYHTGVKDVYFRMDVNRNSAIIGISLEHRDLGLQELLFQQFQELKSMLHATLGEELQWKLHVPLSENRVVSRIYNELKDRTLFNKEHWADLINFFKPRIIALDKFWQEAHYSFEALQ